MAIFRVARFDVRADARETAERAMHELASYIRSELPGSLWTAYCDPDVPTRFTCFLRTETPAADAKHRSAPGVKAFDDALASMLVGDIEVGDLALVTSTDLAPRRRSGRR